MQRNVVHQCAHRATFVLPTKWSERAEDVVFRGQMRAYHIAVVARGILSSSGIVDSSTAMLDSEPASSSYSRASAETVPSSTSPPIYRHKSAKCVACSTIGPHCFVLFHQSILRIREYAQVYLALTVMILTFSCRITEMACCTTLRYRSMYPTDTAFPEAASACATGNDSSGLAVDTGFSANMVHFEPKAAIIWSSRSRPW